MEQGPHIPFIQPDGPPEPIRGEAIDALAHEMDQLMGDVDLGSALSLFLRIHPVHQSDILVELSHEHRQRLLKALAAETYQEILSSMRDAREIVTLLQHRHDSAGGLMPPDYPVAPVGTTAGNALDRLRLLGRAAGDISAFWWWMWWMMRKISWWAP